VSWAGLDLRPGGRGTGVGGGLGTPSAFGPGGAANRGRYGTGVYGTRVRPTVVRLQLRCVTADEIDCEVDRERPDAS